MERINSFQTKLSMESVTALKCSASVISNNCFIGYKNTLEIYSPTRSSGYSTGSHIFCIIFSYVLELFYSRAVIAQSV
jgi:hypothetical protein